MGIFPWFSEEDPILWYAPHERCVIFPDQIKVSKSMRKILQSHTFEFTVNKSFIEVIKQCAEVVRHGQGGTWITDEMQEAYIKLHHLGHAQSIEVWQNGTLVGACTA
jgi:leucyl/phenylalanyl-tRNA--protein transferase